MIALTGHTYIADTKDASLVPFLLPITADGDVNLYASKHGVDTLTSSQISAMAQEARGKPLPTEHDALHVECHCGGVELRIKRADYAQEPEGVRALMSKDDPHKYLARFCACRSCRIAVGSSLCPWAYTSLPAITNSSTGQPITFGRRAVEEEEGSNEGLQLKHYQSNEGTWRSFCKKCGASVFYYTEGSGRDDVVDVAVGLLRAGSGSLAREWVRWADGEVSCGEEGTDGEQVEVVKGLGREA